MNTLIINNKKTTYKINENGEIYNIKTKKYLQGTVRNGYRAVKLTIDGIKKDYLVHRLVAQTFLDNPNNFLVVNHKDGNKLNNNVNNLEWVTQSDNIIHAIYFIGKKPRQKILPIQETIDAEHGWKQYKNTNYWFNKDGRGANIKTKKYLNLSIKNDGYGVYYLYLNKKRLGILAHRIIYETFNEFIPDNMQINHIDGNKLNNKLENLELVTRSENMVHSFYVLKHNVKSVCQCDLQGHILYTYQSIKEAARITGFNDSAIVQACKGKIKTYKGYTWKYLEEQSSTTSLNDVAQVREMVGFRKEEDIVST